jgi:superfamily II DNA or RNA helicase
MHFGLKNKAILTGMSSETTNAIRQQFTISNPAYGEAERMGRYTGGIPRHLKFYEDTPTGLICPRGAVFQLYMICDDYGEQIQVVNKRLELNPVDFTFIGTLRQYQQNAISSVLEQDHGTLSAATGSGKTCMGLNIIAQRKQPALIICHTKELQNQWISAIEKFLGIPADQVGVIGGGKHFFVGKQITVALVQSLYSRLDKVIPYIGQVVVDECHRAPSRTFTQALTAFPARYRLGLTATPYRRDGLDKAIQWHIGPITGRIDKKDLLDNGNLCQAEAVFIKTGFTPVADPSDYYSQALSELTQDLDRNRLISRTVKSHNGSGITLILSERREHCEYLGDILRQEQGIQAAVLTGQTPAKERDQIIQDLQAGACQYLVATGSLIGEGFDLPEIGTLLLATPIKFSGKLIQYVGRALRPAPGKSKAVIMDFVDGHGVFENSARARWGTYKQQGIKVTGGF